MNAGTQSIHLDVTLIVHLAHPGLLCPSWSYQKPTTVTGPGRRPVPSDFKHFSGPVKAGPQESGVPALPPGAIFLDNPGNIFYDG
jgi:hypothetical protein